MSDGSRERLEKLIRAYGQANNGHRDLLPVYANPEAMERIVRYLAKPFYGKVDYVAAPESLGFVLGSLLAAELRVGLVAIRNSERYSLPKNEALQASYIDHRNMTRTLRIRRDILKPDGRILLADDWIETAATMQACISLVEEADCHIAGIATLCIEAQAVGKFKHDTEEIRCICRP